MTVAPVENPVLLALQEREVHLVSQAMHGQGSKERRAVKGDKAPPELLDCPVCNNCGCEKSSRLGIQQISIRVTDNFLHAGVKGEPGQGTSLPGPRGVPGIKGDSGSPGLQGRQRHSFVSMSHNVHHRHDRDFNCPRDRVSPRFWQQVTEVCRETPGCQVSQDKRVNMEPLELDFQAQLVQKVC